MQSLHFFVPRLLPQLLIYAAPLWIFLQLQLWAKILYNLCVCLFQVLYIALCVLVLTQMNKKADVPVVAYSQEAKAGNYTTLAEFT